MELRRSKGHDVHLDAVDRVHLAVGGRGRGLLLELALLVAGHIFSVSGQRCAGRSVSVAAPLPMRVSTELDQFHALPSRWPALSACSAIAQGSTKKRAGLQLGPSREMAAPGLLSPLYEAEAKTAKFRPPQAPRIAVAAARTRPEPSQASKDRATRTLRRMQTLREADLSCHRAGRARRRCVLPTTPCTWLRTNAACGWSVHSEGGLPCLAIILLPIASNASYCAL